MIVRCHAKCGNYRIIPTTCNVGEICERTKYHTTFSIGDIVFYCPSCYDKAQNLAYGLLLVLKDKHVRLEDFFPRETHKPFFPLETTGVTIREDVTPSVRAITLDV